MSDTADMEMVDVVCVDPTHQSEGETKSGSNGEVGSEGVKLLVRFDSVCIVSDHSNIT